MRWNSKRPKQERGVAMLLALLTLLLVAIIGMGFMFMANTENSANSNYKDAQKAYFASRAGLESVRSMLTPGSAFTLQANALTAPAKLAPTGVIYVENTNGGALPDPTMGAANAGNTVALNPSLDDELCHEQFGGLGMAAGPLGVPCGSGPGGNNELMPAAPNSNYYQAVVNPAQIVNAGTASALPFPWVRVTNKYNAMGLLGGALVTPGLPGNAQVCWDGATETAIPVGQTCAGTPSPTTGGQLNPVWMLTSLAVTPGVGNNPGTRRVTQMEVAINPPFYVLPNGTVSAKAPITIKGNLQVNGYDNCNCTSTGANRPGMICNAKPYAIYSNNTISQNGNAATLTSGEPQPTLQNVNPWPYNVDDLINAYRNSGAITPGDISCTGTPDFTAKPPVYASCGVTGDNFGTYPPPPGPPTTSAGSIPQTTYIPGSVKLSGNAGAGVLIIDGDLDVHGGLQFYGLILVRGQINFTGGGSQKVNLYGAILAGEDVNAQDVAMSDTIGGSFSFTYDSCALKQGGIQKPGPPTLLAEHEVMY
jgi:hypothetical protein